MWIILLSFILILRIFLDSSQTCQKFACLEQYCLTLPSLQLVINSLSFRGLGVMISLIITAFSQRTPCPPMNIIIAIMLLILLVHFLHAYSLITGFTSGNLSDFQLRLNPKKSSVNASSYIMSSVSILSEISPILIS